MDDYEEKLFEKKKIILYVSYKGLEAIIGLREKLGKLGISIKILNLTYYDFSSMNDRLISNPLRNHTQEELTRRINSAYSDELLFGKDVLKNANLRLYTDTISVQETFDIVSKIYNKKI